MLSQRCSWTSIICDTERVSHAYYNIISWLYLVLIQKLFHSFFDSFVQIGLRLLICLNSFNLVFQLNKIPVFFNKRKKSPTISRIGNEAYTISVFETIFEDIMKMLLNFVKILLHWFFHIYKEYYWFTFMRERIWKYI